MKKSREFEINIPILMTKSEDEFLIINNELAIFIQSGTVEKVIYAFKIALESLLKRWVAQDTMLEKLRHHGFIKEKSVPKMKLKMPNIKIPTLELGTYENVGLVYA